MSTTKESIQAQVQQSYDSMAEKYTQWVESRPSPRLRYVDKMLSLLRPQDHDDALTSTRLAVLELGCGAGVPVTIYLANSDKIGYVVANDLSEKQLELARQRFAAEASDGKVEFRGGDMLELTFERETFDGVVACFSLFHLPIPGQRSMLEKIRAWMRPGGVLVCNFGAKASTPDGQPEAGGAAGGEGQGSLFFDQPMFWANLGTNGSVEMVKNAGFEVLETEVLDATDGQEVLDEGEADAGVEFVWVVARKGSV